MEEVFCYLLPASICTYMVNKQVKKMSNQNLILIYLISTLFIYLIGNGAFLLFRNSDSYKLFTVKFATKYMLFASFISFLLGILFSYIINRFSLKIEVKKHEKKSK